MAFLVVPAAKRTWGVAGATKYLKIKRRRHACQREVGWNFVCVRCTHSVSARCEHRSGPEPPSVVLACPRLGRNKKRTDVSLVCTILGDFINQPTSFTRARRCSISRRIPRRTLTKVDIHQRAPCPPPSSTALHKAVLPP